MNLERVVIFFAFLVRLTESEYYNEYHYTDDYDTEIKYRENGYTEYEDYDTETKYGEDDYDTETKYGENDYTDKYDTETKYSEYYYTDDEQDTTECVCVGITLKDENSGKIYDIN